MCAKMQHRETGVRVDRLGKALGIVKKIPIGEARALSELVTKRGGEKALAEAVKQLIEAGWCEYEFTNDYSGVRRLDLPDFARTYFKNYNNEKSS